MGIKEEGRKEGRKISIKQRTWRQESRERMREGEERDIGKVGGRQRGKNRGRKERGRKSFFIGKVKETNDIVKDSERQKRKLCNSLHTAVISRPSLLHFACCSYKNHTLLVLCSYTVSFSEQVVRKKQIQCGWSAFL